MQSGIHPNPVIGSVQVDGPVHKEFFFIRCDNPVIRKLQNAILNRNRIRSHPERGSDHRHIDPRIGKPEPTRQYGTGQRITIVQVSLQRTRHPDRSLRQESLSRGQRQSGQIQIDCRRRSDRIRERLTLQSQGPCSVQIHLSCNLRMQRILTKCSGQIEVCHPASLVRQRIDSNRSAYTKLPRLHLKCRIGPEHSTQRRHSGQRFQRRLHIDSRNVYDYAILLGHHRHPFVLMRQAEVRCKSLFQTIGQIIIRVDRPLCESKNGLFVHPHGDRTVGPNTVPSEIVTNISLPVGLNALKPNRTVDQKPRKPDIGHIDRSRRPAMQPYIEHHLALLLSQMHGNRIQGHLSCCQTGQPQRNIGPFRISRLDIQRQRIELHAFRTQETVQQVVRSRRSGKSKYGKHRSNRIHIKGPLSHPLRRLPRQTAESTRHRIDRSRSCKSQIEITRVYRSRRAILSGRHRSLRRTNIGFLSIRPEFDPIQRDTRRLDTRAIRSGRHTEIGGSCKRLRHEVQSIKITGIEPTVQHNTAVGSGQSAIDVNIETQSLTRIGEMSRQGSLRQSCLHGQFSIIVPFEIETVHRQIDLRIALRGIYIESLSTHRSIHSQIPERTSG